MNTEVKIPVIGESVQYAQIANWLVSDGDFVEKDQDIVEIDSDKATLTLVAEEAGKIKIIAEAGAKVTIGEVIAQIDTKQEGGRSKQQATSSKEQGASNKETDFAEVTSGERESYMPEAPQFGQAEPVEAGRTPDNISITPLAKEMIAEHNIDLSGLISHKLRISKSDVIAYQNIHSSEKPKTYSRNETVKEMSPLRKKLSERLVKAKNQSAMLTTFNEVDMSNILAIRKQFGEEFQKKYGVKLGFMSFFTKAVTEALKEFPEINATLEGDNIIYHDYMDIGMAVSTPKGLMVPIIRNAEALNIPELEKAIADFAEKARNKKITIEDMTGGTFTITNGGVFGSLLSTPIINPPQVAILGMHKIQERPVGINGKIELRPMMYLALSYDHRIVDGKESVSFLVKVIEMLQNPVRILANGKEPERALLGI